MLLLGRKTGEEIWINQGEIKVHIHQVQEGYVLVGIDAPKKIDIVRKELVKGR